MIKQSLFDPVIMMHDLPSLLHPSNATIKVALWTAANNYRRVDGPPHEPPAAAPASDLLVQVLVETID
jgi:hypothetical protein